MRTDATLREERTDREDRLPEDRPPDLEEPEERVDRAEDLAEREPAGAPDRREDRCELREAEAERSDATLRAVPRVASSI